MQLKVDIFNLVKTYVISIFSLLFRPVETKARIGPWEPLLETVSSKVVSFPYRQTRSSERWAN